MNNTYIKKSHRYVAMEFNPSDPPEKIDEFFTNTDRCYQRVLGLMGKTICLEIEGDYGDLLAYPGAWMVIYPCGKVELWHHTKFKATFEQINEK